jgi:DMSO/TMAO reductase YedYZ molybdopterin-dependent catalytic subunit
MMDRRQLLLGAALLGGQRLTRARPQASLPAAVEEDSGFVKSYAFQNLSDSITPAEQFFVRNHFVQPSLSPEGWKLAVEGEVDRPLELSYQDLQGLPAASEVATLECAGNPMGGGMISTGKWTGPTLLEVLQRAGIRPEAREVILEGADRGPVEEIQQSIPFARAIPIEKAMHSSTLLAHTLNDRPLPAALGFPMRAVVPGWYAPYSVKWLARILVSKAPFDGFFQSRRYVFVRHGKGGFHVNPVREMRVKSQIARPVPNTLLSRRPYVIRGGAWSGEAEIKAVEVSLDRGKNWQPATLGGESVPYAWRLWEFPWPGPQPGVHVIGCRAIDSAGRRQPLEPDEGELTAYGKHAVGWVKVTVR